MIVAKLIAVLVAASPVPDTEYEEILSHRSTLHGSPMGAFFGWGEPLLARLTGRNKGRRS